MLEKYSESWFTMNAFEKRHRRPGLRGRATCEKCGARLGYEVGSIKWECVEVDMCPSCRGGAIARELLEEFDRALART